jgi:glycosyltransferase involved in cell wall biosynthesis
VKARLVILGKGRLQAKMRQLADRLGVSSDMQLPGFVENPYPHMAAAAVFVLSSAWEGSPNVLVEAMALGTPVAATDCPSGPREILQDGAYGRLTAVGDAEGLAEAIRETLAEPPDRHRLTAGALRYTVQASSAAYLAAFGIRPEQPVRPCPARVFSGAQERGVQTA